MTLRRQRRLRLLPSAILASAVMATVLAGGAVIPTPGHVIHDATAAAASHVQVSPLAAVELSPVLDRAGWTATTDSAEPVSLAGAVLDGDSTSYWHTEWSARVPALPHWITLDMKTSQAVAGLRYAPRQDGSYNGNIGQFEVQTSSDNTTFTTVASGTWADDNLVKSVSFASVSVRYVRLRALTEAGNRGQWSSASEINLVGPAASTPYLDRAGWQASADSQESTSANNAAALALDGNTGTIWHTQWGANGAPLPHWLIIDLGAAREFQGLAYTPRQDGSYNGIIGSYRVEVSNDNASWNTVASGTWADSLDEKVASFASPVTARYVRLNALSEAGGRGPWSSAAEINLVRAGATTGGGGGGGTGNSTGTQGSWGSTIGFPLVPSSAALLPGNKVLLWSAYAAMNYGSGAGYTLTAILDLTTGAVSQRLVNETGHDMFCPGVAMLPDGRIMVTGGSDAAKTSIYNPATNTWTAGPALSTPRGYNAMTLLDNGQVINVGGSWSGGTGGKSAELYTPGSGWKALPGISAEELSTADPRGVFRGDNHAWLNVVSGGRLLHSGPSKAMHWISTTGQGSLSSAGLRGDAPDAMNGNAVLYDVDQILTVGGSPAYENSNATARAYTVDASGSQPVVRRSGDMAAARAFANSVVLPTGEVLVVGGQAYAAPFTDTNAALRPELWSPATGRFTQLATGPTARTYHSVALLLPDARVLSAGGGQCGGCATNHPDGQIFSPPYLLNADGTQRVRPTITSAPSKATRGTNITVRTRSAVSSFALVRYSEATHSVNNDQRRIPLRIASSSGTQYRLAVPGKAGVVLPGLYMLFAMDAAGTPSVAATVQIG